MPASDAQHGAPSKPSSALPIRHQRQPQHRIDHVALSLPRPTPQRGSTRTFAPPQTRLQPDISMQHRGLPIPQGIVAALGLFQRARESRARTRPPHPTQRHCWHARPTVPGSEPREYSILYRVYTVYSNTRIPYGTVRIKLSYSCPRAGIQGISEFPRFGNTGIMGYVLTLWSSAGWAAAFSRWWRKVATVGARQRLPDGFRPAFRVRWCGS